MPRPTWLPSYFRALPRMLLLVWTASPRLAAAAIAFTAVGGLVPALQIWVTKEAVDWVVSGLQSTEESGIQSDWGALIRPVGLILGVWTLGTICQSVTVQMRMLLGLRSAAHVEERILRKAAGLDLAFFETPRFHDNMESARSQAGKIHNVAYGVTELLGTLISTVTVLALLAGLHPGAVAVLLATTMPQVFGVGYYTERYFRLWKSRAQPRRTATYLSSLLGSRDAAKEVRLFGLQRHLLSRFRECMELFLGDARSERIVMARIDLVFGLLSTFGTAGIWAYAISQAASGYITIGYVVLAFQAAVQARSSLTSVFKAVGRFHHDCLYGGALFAFLDMDTEGMEGVLTVPVDPQPLPGKTAQDIVLEKVGFCYPESDRQILDGISCRIRPGETVALVGENGAGKTTMVKLLARLYDPTEGRIVVGGSDLRHYEPEAWRRQIGVIFQDYARYDLTLRDNIGFGQVSDMDDRKRILMAAESGGAAGLVESLPDGLETTLGKTFDHGVDLSGGEWQKVALSRAFMRDAQVLILDEPTAALDALAEAEVFERFARLTMGRTTVLISHRFSTVRLAQHILVLEHGRLTEEGSHEELMELRGTYATMYSTQAERYR